MPIGRIKVWLENKGFGFIVTEGHSPDIFVHISRVQFRPIQQGDIVCFDLQFDAQGRPLASNVRRAERGERLSNWEEIPEVRERKAREIFSEALIARQNKEYERARQLFEQAISLSPQKQFFEAYAAMEKNLGYLDRARKVYNEARTKHPDDVQILTSLAMVEKKVGNLNECVQILRIALEKHPKMLELHIHLAQNIVDLAEQSGQFEILNEAREHFHKAIRLNVEQRSHYHKMWILYRKRSRTAWLLLKKAGFWPIKWRVNLPKRNIDPIDAWFLVNPRGYKHSEMYSLDKNLLVYCPYTHVITPSKVKQGIDLLKQLENRDLSIKHDLLFIVLPDVRNVSDYLKQLLENPGENPTVIPIEEPQAYNVLNDENALHDYLKQLLDEWVFQRDLYKDNFPVSGRRFFGREREIGQLNQSINDGRSVGIFGLRKSGKTSLFYQLKLIRKEDAVAYVDPEASTFEDCAWICWKAIQEWESQRRQDTKALNLPRFLSGENLPDFPQVIQYFAASIQHLMSTLSPDAKLILMIDEIDKVVPMKGKEWKHSLEFFRFLRGVTQQSQGKFVVLISGANPAICEMAQWSGEDNPVFQFFEEMYLPLLPEKECREMIVTLGKGMGVDWSEEALHVVYELTGGHPFITRRLCSTLVRMFPHRPLHVTADKVEKAKEEFLMQFDILFKEIEERLKRDYPEEWDALEAVANGFSLEEIKQLIPGWRIALRHLEGYQLIEQKENQLKIKIKLLHEWLTGGLR